MKMALCTVLAAISVLMLSSRVYAQGETAVPFLLISPDAGAGGMGEAATGLADNANTVFWNPGGLAFLRGNQISLTHAPWLPEFGSDLSYDFLAYTHYLSSWDGNLGASVTYFNLGTFNRTTSASPTIVGTWHAYEFAITLGYGTQVSPGLGVGANFRYIRSELAPFGTEQEVGNGIASDVSFDLGLLYRPRHFNLPLVGDLGDRLGFGVDLSNLGPNLYYIDQAQADPLPTNLRVGLALHLLKSRYNNMYLTLDLSRIMVKVTTDSSISQISPNANGAPDTTWNYTNNVAPLPQSLITSWSDGGLKRVIVSFGAEYWYGSPRLIALRWGYYKENPNFGGRNFMTFGAGIRYGIYGFDFSYISTFDQNNPLSNQLRFSLSLNLGGRNEF